MKQKVLNGDKSLSLRSFNAPLPCLVPVAFGAAAILRHSVPGEKGGKRIPAGGRVCSRRGSGSKSSNVSRVYSRTPVPITVFKAEVCGKLQLGNPSKWNSMESRNFCTRVFDKPSRSSCRKGQGLFCQRKHPGEHGVTIFAKQSVVY